MSRRHRPQGLRPDDGARGRRDPGYSNKRALSARDVFDGASGRNPFDDGGDCGWSCGGQTGCGGGSTCESSCDSTCGVYSCGDTCGNSCNALTCVDSCEGSCEGSCDDTCWYTCGGYTCSANSCKSATKDFQHETASYPELQGAEMAGARFNGRRRWQR